MDNATTTGWDRRSPALGARRARERSAVFVGALITAALLLAACAAPPPPVPAPPPETGPPDVLADLSLDERAALLVAVPAEATQDDLVRWVHGRGVRTLWFAGEGPVPDVPTPRPEGADTLEADTLPPPPPPPLLHLQDLAGVEAVSPLLLGAGGRIDASESQGLRTARELRQRNRHLALLTVPFAGTTRAPVHHDPEAAYAGAIRYLEGAGLTGLRTGIGLGMAGSGQPDPRDRAGWEAHGLSVLRGAVGAGIDLVDLPLGTIPILTGRGEPLAHSVRGVEGLLRRDLAFDGVALVRLDPAEPVVAEIGEREAAIRAVAAGADLVYVPGSPDAVIASLTVAVQRGRIPAWRLDEAARRVLALREAALRAPPAAPSSSQTTPPAPAPVFRLGPAHRIALPLSDGARIVLLHSRETSDGEAQQMAAALEDRGPPVGIVRTDLGTLNPAGDRRVLQALLGADIALALDGPAALAALGAESDPLGVSTPVMQVIRGAAPDDPSPLPALWTERGGAEGALALAAALRGQSAVLSPSHRYDPFGTTVLRPVSALEVGLHPDSLRRVDALVGASIRGGVFPGATLAIGRRGGLVMQRGYGGDTRRGTVVPATPDTRFDLASLTKVVGTTSAIMALVDDGKLSLETRVVDVLPDFRGRGKADVRIRHLLTHTSGLPAGAALANVALSPRDALSRVLATPLRTLPEAEVVYSDWGPIILAAVVERVSGEPIDRYLARRVFGPLGMSSTGYLPPLAVGRATAPTVRGSTDEADRRGVVHDPNAFRLGGVTGHAGLFSTARDLATFAQMMLNEGSYGDVRIFRPQTVRTFTARQPGAGHRALGWETANGAASSGGTISPRAFGHTGFTGTSIWIDPENELFVILLTARTYDGSSSAPVQRLRRGLNDLVAGAIVEEEEEGEMEEVRKLGAP